MNEVNWPTLHREQIGPIIGYMNGLPVREWYTERTEQPIDADGRAIEEAKCENTQQ
jgi:hypothetical protein